VDAGFSFPVHAAKAKRQCNVERQSPSMMIIGASQQPGGAIMSENSGLKKKPTRHWPRKSGLRALGFLSATALGMSVLAGLASAESMDDLVAQLRDGRYRPVDFRAR